MGGRDFLLVFAVITTFTLVCSYEEILYTRRRDIEPEEYDDYILVCNQEPLDLAFIIDASASIWKRNFTIGLEFVQDFVDMYDIGPDMVRIAAVTFGRGVYRQGSFSFSTYETKEEVKDAVGAIRYPAGRWTGTGDAINYFVRKQFIPDARPNVPHLCIVLTDGNSQERRKTQRAALAARELNVTMFAIGVGDKRRVKESELLSIAGDKKRIFRTNNYAELNKVKKKLAFQTCYKKPKPTTPPAAQPCGIEFPTDIEFVYDAASLGPNGNSFVSQFTSHTFDEEGMEDGMQLGVNSGLCPEDGGFDLGKYGDKASMRGRLDKLYDPKRIGEIVKQGLARGMSGGHGGRTSANVNKVAVVFVGGKVDTEYLAGQIEAANATMGGKLNVFFSDAGEGAGVAAGLSQRFHTPPLTGGSLEQSAILHTAICGDRI